MANRSYLYACNEIPGTSATPEKNLIGLSESNYEIPLAYKVLLSPNPSTCRSRIWHSEEHLAITGDYDTGLAALSQFLAKITLSQVQPAIKETLAFLHNPDNRRQYLLLECAEIFELHGAELGEQNKQLADDLLSLNELKAQALSAINAQADSTQKKRFGFFPRKSSTQATPDAALRTAAELGLYSWSNTLYYDFN